MIKKYSFFSEKLGVIIMAKTSFYLLVNQTAGEKPYEKTAGKEDPVELDSSLIL